MVIFPQFEAQEAIPGEFRQTPLFGLNIQALGGLSESLALPAYRARQVWHALYRERVSKIEDITSLPMSVRHRLTAAGYSVGVPNIAQAFQSSDGTERYLIACGDGETVETVWMPNGDDGEIGDGSEAAQEEFTNERDSGTLHSTSAARAYRRATICISSQVGCAVNCQFCLTAKLGIKRNLTAGEIAGQVIAVFNRHQVRVGRDRINLVFMGMGEPFLNYENFMAAVHLLVEGTGIPESRMTVSTSGILPGLERFAKEKLRPKLALSLNAPNDSIREAMMPITRKWNIGSLLAAMRKIPLRPRERLTFEYVLLGGVNDRLQDARELATLLKSSGIESKVNLIVWNPGPEIPYRMPSPEDVTAFQTHLIASGVPAFLRRPRGRDIYAACGQLKRTLE
ncbi:MAG TPA: 23S rRNA (adenine(2503)-C(2))-methyltransferase RlmN [Acidobacteriaceae bacterium]|nr:23S rRNA (adenine(2503)-C(2))-methyltransferase RlmN [Acidobacteriaceae bacterium]